MSGLKSGLWYEKIVNRIFLNIDFNSCSRNIESCGLSIIPVISLTWTRLGLVNTELVLKPKK